MANDNITCCIQAYSILPTNIPSYEQILKQLLSQNPSMQQLDDSLAEAVRLGNTDVVTQLITHGANPGMLDTSLLYLAWQQKNGMFDLLLKNGAQITVEQQDLYAACPDFLSAYEDLAPTTISNRIGYKKG